MDNPNDLHHIFGNRRHNLDRLVQQYGSREAARAAIQASIDAAFVAGELSIDARGVFEATVGVGGNQVTVRGAVHQGTARIGSAWVFA